MGRTLDEILSKEDKQVVENAKIKAESLLDLDSIVKENMENYIKNNTEVNLQYFKKSGKYYSSGQYATDKTSYYEIIQEVRGMLQEGNLPDLVEGCSEFDVYIAPNKGEYFPIIIKL